MMLGIIKKVISNTLIDYKNMQTVQMLFEPLAKKHRRIMELVKLNASVYKGRVRESFFMIIQTKGYIGINIHDAIAEAHKRMDLDEFNE